MANLGLSLNNNKNTQTDNTSLQNGKFSTCWQQYPTDVPTRTADLHQPSRGHRLANRLPATILVSISEDKIVQHWLMELTQPAVWLTGPSAPAFTVDLASEQHGSILVLLTMLSHCKENNFPPHKFYSFTPVHMQMIHCVLREDGKMAP